MAHNALNVSQFMNNYYCAINVLTHRCYGHLCFDKFRIAKQCQEETLRGLVGCQLISIVLAKTCGMVPWIC